jgi:hypothetical protein
MNIRRFIGLGLSRDEVEGTEIQKIMALSCVIAS